MIAVSAFSAAAAVGVVALAFAFYAVLEPWLGRAGAAATLASTTAVAMAVAGMIVAVAARPKRAPPTPQTAEGLIERALTFVKQRPVLSVSAALAAGLLAIRNPKYLGSALRAFVEGPPAGKP